MISPAPYQLPTYTHQLGDASASIWTDPAPASFSLAPGQPSGTPATLQPADTINLTSPDPAAPPMTYPRARSTFTVTGSGRRLSPEELRNLQKIAKDINIPRLSGDSTFGVFSAWKSAISDWLLGVGVTGEELHSDTVKYLAHRMFTSEFHEELRR